MTPSNIYIFDLDGTLALIEHRRHFVEGPVKDWDAFHAACVDDKPNYPVIQILRALQRDDDNLIWIFSGRSDAVRKETLAWLQQAGVFVQEDQLWMRNAGDHQPDDRLKEGWLDLLHADTKQLIRAIFDDRDRLVAMWRRRGYTCLQVAPGNF